MDRDLVCVACVSSGLWYKRYEERNGCMLALGSYPVGLVGTCHPNFQSQTARYKYVVHAMTCRKWSRFFTLSVL